MVRQDASTTLKNNCRGNLQPAIGRLRDQWSVRQLVPNLFGIKHIVKHFFVRRWFLLALAIVLAVGITQSSILAPLSERKMLRYGIVAIVLFLMALPLDARAMWKAMRRPWAPLLAVVINFGLLPLVAWGVSFGLSREMAGGLYVAAATPCTLASAAVWTRRAGGNDSVAILVTVITNLICVLLTPLWLFAMTGERADIAELSLANMITKLALLVVLPMALAQLIRLIPGVAEVATRRKTPIGVLAQFGVLSMIFIGAIRTGVKLMADEDLAYHLFDIGLMIVAVLGLHLAMMVVGMVAAFYLRFPREDRIAVGIAGSQKTLMVGLQMGLELGLSVLPIVVYHVGQLLLDTIIADRLRANESAAKSGSAKANS